MTDVAKAMQLFWSGFQIPAYVEYCVPKRADLPYITYTLSQAHWANAGVQEVRIWYRDGSFTEINRKIQAVRDAIGACTTVRTDHGYLFLYLENVQFQPMDEDTIKVAHLTMHVNYLTN